MFFPYTEVESKPRVVSFQGDTIISDLEYDIIQDVDTRDNSEIYVVKIITRVEDFKPLRQEMKSLGGYYSRFKRGFIFKEDPTTTLQGDSEDAGTDVKEACA